MLRDADGQVRQLKVGDMVRKGEVVLTDQDGIVQIEARPNGQPDVIERVIAEVDQGNPDVAPAAGPQGGDGDLQPGLRVDRVTETVTPAGMATEAYAAPAQAARANEADLGTRPDEATPDTATPDTVTLAEDGSATFDPRTNDDFSSDGTPAIQTVAGQPIAVGSPVTLPQGTVTLHPDGTLSFTPAPDFHGTVVIPYTAGNGSGTPVGSTITITVTPVNDAPTANPDAARANEDSVLVIDPRGNDTDPDGDPLTITHINGRAIAVGAPVALPEGTLSLNPDGRLSFQPLPNYNGPLSFDYTVTDGQGAEATATVNLTIDPVDDASVLAADTASIAEDASVNGNVLANDSDSDSALTVASFTVAGVAGNFTAGQTAVIAGVGSLILAADGSYTFTPAANYNGAAPTVSYTTNTGSTSTLDITITPVDDASMLAADTATTAEDTPISSNVLANDSDVDSTLTVASFTVAGVAGSFSAGQPAAIAGVGSLVLAADGSYTFTPAASYNGAVPTVSYTTNTGSTSTLDVTVTPVDDPSVLVADAATTAEDTPVSGNVLANDSDVDGTLTIASFTVAGVAGSFSAGQTAAIAGVGSLVLAADGSYTFTPAASYNGAAPTVSYTTNTGSTSTLDVTVTPVDDPSVLVADAATTAEDIPVSGNVLANDSDVDSTLTVASFTVAGVAGGFTAGQTAVLAGVGSLALAADGNYIFTPAANYNGSVPQVSYTTNTGLTSTLDITVAPVNDAPVAVDDAASTPINTPISNIAVLANDTDLDGDTLAVTGATVDPALGTVVVNHDGTLDFTPALNVTGPVTITYAIADGQGGTSTATLAVNVGGNHPPTGADAAFTLPEDGSRLFTAADFGFADANPGQTLAAVRIDTLPGAGTLTLNGTPVAAGQVIPAGALADLLFTPAADASGSAYASFTFSVQDSADSFDTTPNTITLNATPVDDVSVLVADAATTAEDTPVSGNVLANDSDVDSTLTIASFTVAGVAGGFSAGQTAAIAGVGTLALAADGSYTFTPAANYNGSVPQVSYTTNTGSTSTLAITVTPVDDPSVLVADIATTAEDTPVSGNVLANDSDVDGALTVASFVVSGVAGSFTAGQTATIVGVGTLAIASDGTYAFTPAANYNGAVPTVSYTTDTGSSSTLEITVTPVNDASVLAADTATTAEDASVSGNVLANDSDVDDTLPVASFAVAGVAGSFTAGQTAVIAGVGALMLVADGGYTFTPAANYNGAVPTVSYTTNTGSTSTLDITVTPVDDASVLVADVTTTAEDTPVSGSVLTNDSDVDNALTVASFTVAGIAGSFTAGQTAVIAGVGSLMLAADGSYTFTPAANYNGSVPQVSYTTNTGSTSTLDITVTPVNDTPVLSGESVATLEDTAVAGNVLANDADIDGGALAVTSFSWDGVVHAIAAGASTTATVAGVGTLTLASDGSYSFEPAGNHSGQVPVVSYTVSDGSASSTAVLDLGVTAVADAPTLVLNSTTIVDGDSSDNGPPASTGLTREFHDELALTTAAAVDATNLEAAVEAAAATSVSTVTDVAIAQADFDTGDAYRYTGYVYLEAGHTYTLSGNRDDTMIIKVGGETVYSLGFNNWGSFSADGFTPAASGYYSLEVNVFDGNGVGVLDVNMSVDGAPARDLNTTNFDLYADADDIIGSAALGDFVSNNDGGYYPGAPTGSDGSFIPLGSITASLADTDGSESLAITVGAIPVGATLSDGTHSFTATAGVTSVDVSTWDLGALQFMSPSGFSGVVDLTVTATATEASNGSSASSAGGLRVIIADATPPDLFTADTLIVVNQGTSSASTYRQVTFPVAVALAAGETLSSLVVNSLPVGVVISDGTNSFTASMADNSVDVSSWNLSGLTLTVPTSFSNAGTTITVTATSTVHAEVDGVTTAIDSASSTDSLTLIADYTTTTATGSGANDTLSGTAADNHIDAAAGNDTVSAADGNDLVLGGAGDDSIGGGAGSDLLYGGTGNDTLAGGSQSDRLIGGAGNDTLTGGSGGNDLVTDVFQWQLGDSGAAGSPAADTITDFNASAASAGGDILDLRDLLVGESSSNLTDYLHFSSSGGSTVVSISTNGAFAGGYDSGLVNQTITLAGIDLVGAKTDAQIIEDLLKNGSLVAGG